MATMNHEAVKPVCGSASCYPGDRCAPCRLALGDSCEACGAAGEVLGGMFGELVLCAACKAADEGCACEGTGAVARDGGFDACPAGCEGSVR
jgi:hypothetical protein